MKSLTIAALTFAGLLGTSDASAAVIIRPRAAVIVRPALIRPAVRPAMIRPVVRPAVIRPVVRPALIRPAVRPAMIRPAVRPAVRAGVSIHRHRVHHLWNR